MGKIEIFAIIFAVTIIGVRIYLKYFKKQNKEQVSDSKSRGSEFGSPSKDDDYEPYSGK